MKRNRCISLWVALALLLSIMSTATPAWADGPENGEDAPACSDMPGAQIPGKKTGSACRVAVTAIDKGLLLLAYRSGCTHRVTSESDSDLVEDLIKVEGYLYYWLSGQWQYDDQCGDQHSTSSHAACRTYNVGFDHWKQDGYHYFHKAGFQDTWFSTRDEWTE